MVALWCNGLVKTFRPRLRLVDLLRGRLRPTDSPTLALNGVSFAVEEGEVVALLGPNGAGKTTLLKTLATLVMPDTGEAVIAGHPLREEIDVRRSIGLVTSEERSFYWRLSGRENLAFFAAMHGIEASEAVKRLERLSALFRLDSFLDRRFDACSSGMKQRLALARALLHQPRLLLLDEPTRSIDPVESQALHSAIEEMVKEEKTAVLLVTHDLTEAEKLCRRFLVMRAGQVAFDGSPSELRRRVGGSRGTARYTVRLESAIEGWERAPGLAEGRVVGNDGSPELDVELKPGAAIGDLVTGLHGIGGRVQSIEPHNPSETTELALQEVESNENAMARFQTPRPQHAPSEGTPERKLVQFAAFLRRDLRLHLSYRFAFALGFLGILFNVAVFFYLARLVTEARVPILQEYGTDFFPFILIGIAFRGYLGVALNHFAGSLRAEQMMGTLEMLLASPLKLSTLLGATTSFTFIYHTVTVVGYLLLGVLMGSLSVSRMNIPVALLIMVPTTASFAALGMVSAAFMMTVKRGDPVNFLINASATLFGGVYFPIEVLPASLQLISKVLPITYSLDAMRKALLLGSGVEGVAKELGVLVIFAVVLLPIGLFSFRRALLQARREGTLGQF